MKSVVIIGRPNVGKSTLFNRLIGKRRAITDPTPGVTRDPISEKWILNGHAVMLTDSGGVKLELEGFDRQVAEKSLALLKQADVVLFMMECTGVTPEDLVLVEQLRSVSDKVVVVVNKVDDTVREDLVWNYFSYGYQRVVGISASHGLGIGALEETVAGMIGLEEQADELEAEEEWQGVNLAVLGKPNTGKSTLCNLLTGMDLSIVSPIAGTTRDVVKGDFAYRGKEFVILDTAGIRRKAKVEDDVEYYSVNRAIKTVDEADVVLLVVDVAEGLSEQDKKIASLIVRRGKGVVIVMNKTDLLSGVANERQAIEDRVRFQFPILGFAPICFVSAVTGDGVAGMLDTVMRVNMQLERRIDTATFNNALKAWGEAYQPTRGAEGHFKVYYGTQISVSPVKFLFFVNRRKDFPQTYVQYLKNCIRRDLGFKDIPIEIDLRERERSQSNHKLGQGSKVKASLSSEVDEVDFDSTAKTTAATSATSTARAAITDVAQTPVAKANGGKAKGGKAKAKPAAKKVGAKAKAIAVQKARENYKNSKAGKTQKSRNATKDAKVQRRKDEV